MPYTLENGKYIIVIGLGMIKIISEKEEGSNTGLMAHYMKVFGMEIKQMERED